MGGNERLADALEAPPPELGVAAGLSPRQALALHRLLDACHPAPALVAALWGAARRAYALHTRVSASTRAEGILGRDALRATPARRSPAAFLPAGARPSVMRAALRSAGATAAVSAALTALYGARGLRFELRRSMYAEDDVNQVALSAGVVSADLVVFAAALRAAPFSVAPFLLTHVLT